MPISDEALFRVRLAEGFVEEARQDMSLQRWRSCVDNSQLAAENAAKAALALLGPVGRVHNPATLLRQALKEERFPVDLHDEVKQMAEHSEFLGKDIHI